MPLFVSDYLGDTSHLTTIEHGAYMLLLMTYWQRGKALPADSERLANICRMPVSEWRKIEVTIAELFDVVDATWTHSRVEKELSRAREKSTKARASATRRHSDRSTDAMRTHSEGNTNAQRRQCYSDSDKKETITLPSEQDAAREEKSGFKNPIEGVGLGPERHAEVSPEAKLQACQALNVADVEPLVRVFDDWSRGKAAKASRDAWFLSLAPKLWRNNPAVHAACKPLNEHPPPTVLPPAKASSSLANSKLVKAQRHAS